MIVLDIARLAISILTLALGVYLIIKVLTLINVYKGGTTRLALLTLIGVGIASISCVSTLVSVIKVINMKLPIPIQLPITLNSNLTLALELIRDVSIASAVILGVFAISRRIMKFKVKAVKKEVKGLPLSIKDIVELSMIEKPSEIAYFIGVRDARNVLSPFGEALDLRRAIQIVSKSLDLNFDTEITKSFRVVRVTIPRAGMERGRLDFLISYIRGVLEETVRRVLHQEVAMETSIMPSGEELILEYHF